MGRRRERNHAKSKKLQLIRDHLLKKVPVTKLCADTDVAPSMYYAWQKSLLETGQIDGFGSRKEEAELRKANRRVKQLEEKLRSKDEVLAELLEEHIKLKKKAGGKN